MEDYTKKDNAIYTLNYYCKRNNQLVASAIVYDQEVSESDSGISNSQYVEHLLDEGKRLAQTYKEYDKRLRSISIIVISCIISGLSGFWFEGLSSITKSTWESYVGFSWFFIGLIIATIISKKSESKKPTGYEIYVAYLYSAYEHLDEYKSKKAAVPVQNLLARLKNRIGDPLKRKATLTVLQPISVLIQKIEFNLIPAMKSSESDVKQLQNVLIDLMDCFLGNNFNKINETIDKLNKYPEIKSKSSLQRIQSNRYLYMFIIVLVSVVAGYVVSMISSLVFPKVTDDGKLIAWISITIPIGLFWLRKVIRN